MARRQRHPRDVGDVPGGHDQAARIGVGLDVADQLRDLVDVFAGRRRPRAPLGAVDRTEFAVRIGPFVPDRDAVRLQVLRVGRPRQEPQQFVEDRSGVQLLRRQQREPGGEVEAHLVAEHRTRAGAGPVALDDAVLEHVTHEVEVGLHVGGQIPVKRKSSAFSISSRRPATLPTGRFSAARGNGRHRRGIDDEILPVVRDRRIQVFHHVAEAVRPAQRDDHPRLEHVEEVALDVEQERNLRDFGAHRVAIDVEARHQASRSRRKLR